MKKSLPLLIVIGLSALGSHAQDTLPKFTVKNVGSKRIVVSWINNYELVKQISIQRSVDSVKNFKTIMSVTDPTSRENGFADTKAPGDNLFYRLFIVLDKGGFVFTTSKRPIVDSVVIKPRADNPPEQTVLHEDPASPSIRPDITRTDKLDPEGRSPVSSNREINGNRPNLNVFVPSLHVYTYKDGNVRINLPENDQKKYSIKFFEEDNSFVFEIKDIKQTPVLLDKSNFYHAGWFKFELYEDGKMIEKNKFRISKDF